jgi:hypothetical protein
MDQRSSGTTGEAFLGHEEKEGRKEIEGLLGEVKCQMPKFKCQTRSNQKYVKFSSHISLLPNGRGRVRGIDEIDKKYS